MESCSKGLSISESNYYTFLLSNFITDVKAATKIQSFWRGYYTREYDVDAVRVRREIRARRAEEHIVVLRSELDKYVFLLTSNPTINPPTLSFRMMMQEPFVNSVDQDQTAQNV